MGLPHTGLPWKPLSTPQVTPPVRAASAVLSGSSYSLDNLATPRENDGPNNLLLASRVNAWLTSHNSMMA